MLGQINLQFMEELGCSGRLTGDCTIMNSYLDKVENIQKIVEIFDLPPSPYPCPFQSYLYFPNSYGNSSCSCFVLRYNTNYFMGLLSFELRVSSFT